MAENPRKDEQLVAINGNLQIGFVRRDRLAQVVGFVRRDRLGQVVGFVWRD